MLSVIGFQLCCFGVSEYTRKQSKSSEKRTDNRKLATGNAPWLRAFVRDSFRFLRKRLPQAVLSCVLGDNALFTQDFAQAIEAEFGRIYCKQVSRRHKGTEGKKMLSVAGYRFSVVLLRRIGIYPEAKQEFGEKN